MTQRLASFKHQGLFQMDNVALHVWQVTVSRARCILYAHHGGAETFPLDICCYALQFLTEIKYHMLFTSQERHLLQKSLSDELPSIFGTVVQ